MCSFPSKRDSFHCEKHLFYKSSFAAKINYKLLWSGLGFHRWVTVFCLTLLLRWWVAPGCHPSLTSIDPTHLSHMSQPNQHTASTLLDKWFSQITFARRRAPFLTSPSVPVQTAQQKLQLDKAWLIFNSTIRSTVKGGWVQPLKECGLVLTAQKQLKHPPLSRILQELPIRN